MSGWWHCKKCGRLFRVEPDRVRASCIECGKGPIVAASELHAGLAEDCDVHRIITYTSKRSAP